MKQSRVRITDLLTNTDRLPDVIKKQSSILNTIEDEKVQYLEPIIQNLKKTQSGFIINDKSMKHNFSSLPKSRKWNLNTLYSKTTMNKFKKKSQILAVNALKSEETIN